MSNSTVTPFFYGCIVIGPSGSGKTTFCLGLQQFFKVFERKHIVVNLDPANINSGSKFDINIKELIDLEEVMIELKLGPNAALVYCMDFLYQNIQWLEDRLLQFQESYIIFDFPGQIELYLNNDSMVEILKTLTNPKSKKLTCQLVAVEMFDSINIYETNTYLSQCLMSLVSQMNLELPHINVLSKIDLLKQFGVPPMSLEFYFEAQDLKDMFQKDDSKFKEKYQQLSYSLADLMDTFSKVSFAPLYVEHKDLMLRLLLSMDQANGFFYMENQNASYEQLKKAFEIEGSELISTEIIMQLESELFPDNF